MTTLFTQQPPSVRQTRALMNEQTKARLWVSVCTARTGAAGLRPKGRRYCLDLAKTSDDRPATEGLCVSVSVCASVSATVCVWVCVCVDRDSWVCAQPSHHLQPAATYHLPSGLWRTDGGGTWLTQEPLFRSQWPERRGSEGDGCFRRRQRDWLWTHGASLPP